MLRQAAQVWPPLSPGSANAWLLLVTATAPTWEDPLVRWIDRPPTLGEPNEGFFYPDPLGFWAEVRRWVTRLVPAAPSQWGPPEALAVSALVHTADDPARLTTIRQLCRARLVLFLDEPAWLSSGLEPVARRGHHIPDPHRAGKVYEGFWGRLDDGTVVGKAPQHPTTHRLYRAADMDEFLAGAPG